MLQEVEVIIEPNGEVRLEVRGVPGPGCLEVTRDLEVTLGEVFERRMSAEAFDVAQESQPSEVAVRR